MALEEDAVPQGELDDGYAIRSGYHDFSDCVATTLLRSERVDVSEAMRCEAWTNETKLSEHVRK